MLKANYNEDCASVRLGNLEFDYWLGDQYPSPPFKKKEPSRFYDRGWDQLPMLFCYLIIALSKRQK